MELRHLRYFVAVAEEGSVSLAAEKRLHTAQPSLSRQIRDLETEVGVQLMLRGPRGVELTPAGRVFLDHARIALSAVVAAVDGAQVVARGSASSFLLGFLTGYELGWLPDVMSIMRAQHPNIDIVIRSQSSPELAMALMQGKLDIAFLRPSDEFPDLTFKLLKREPLIVVMPSGHRLASLRSVSPTDLAGEILVNISKVHAPALRRVIDDYIERQGLTFAPGYEAENLPMTISLMLSSSGISLQPLYAKELLPPSVVTRPIAGEAPSIDLAIGYNGLNTSPLLRYFLSKADDLLARVQARSN